jgi:hypothetical protein
MTPSISHPEDNGYRGDSRDCVYLVVDQPSDKTIPPVSPALARFLEEERERYLRGLAYREAQKNAQKEQGGTTGA